MAEATDPERDPDRRARHLAQAAVKLDENVARELGQSADRARSRGGVAAAAAFLRRATELTPDRARRGERALAAAQATFEAGASDAAHELLMSAELGPLDELHRARLAWLRAKIVFARRRGGTAPALLLDAAKRLEQHNDGQAHEAHLEALGAAIFAGRLNGPGPREAAEAARAAPPGPRPPRLIDDLLDGLATRFTEGFVAGVPPLRRALQALRRDAARSEDDIVRWLWLAWPVAGDLWDDESWHELATRAVRRAREAGVLTVLPLALTYRAAVHVHAGEFAAASELIEEAHNGRASTRTWGSLISLSSSSSRRASEAMPAKSPRLPSDNSRNEPTPAARTGPSAYWPGRARYSATTGPPSRCTARRSNASRAAGSPSTSLAHTWCTANGCVARTGASTHANTAYEMLHRFGAEAFADRARRELLAAGESVRQRRVEAREVLTAQEAQLARLAGNGLTNPEIGAELFISHRTVEWHLHKVYTKLNVSSRKELRGALIGS